MKPQFVMSMFANKADLEKAKAEYELANPTPDLRNWGTTKFPKENWIDPKKNYLCGGYRVINISIKLHNDAGSEVTYPVKGTIVLREHPFKTKYAIWSLDGRADVVFGKGNNLSEVQS